MCFYVNVINDILKRLSTIHQSHAERPYVENIYAWVEMCRILSKIITRRAFQMFNRKRVSNRSDKGPRHDKLAGEAA